MTMAAHANTGGLIISVERDRDRIVRVVRPEESAPPPPLTIELVFSEYLDHVYRFVYRQVGNQHDAEDLTSEVFLKAARNLDPSRPEQAVGSWLFSVARTVIADHWRRYYRIPPLVNIDDLELSAAPTGATQPAAHDDQVERILQALPERQARLLRLRFLHGYTIVEAAAELGITAGNAKVMQHRALAMAVRFADEMK
jgi:RNA polymerase sigma factor (sigma-70 family)